MPELRFISDCLISRLMLLTILYCNSIMDTQEMLLNEWMKENEWALFSIPVIWPSPPLNLSNIKGPSKIKSISFLGFASCPSLDRTPPFPYLSFHQSNLVLESGYWKLSTSQVFTLWLLDCGVVWGDPKRDTGGVRGRTWWRSFKVSGKQLFTMQYGIFQYFNNRYSWASV